VTHVEIVDMAEYRQPVYEHTEPIERLAGAFLVGYANLETRRAYEADLRLWFEFCHAIQLDPMQARRSHFSLFMLNREELGNSPATIKRKLTSLRSFYQWLVDEEYLFRNPATAVKPPRVPTSSSRDWMTGNELARIVMAAEEEGGYTYALICLLAYNGLRIGEVARADIEDMGRVRHNHTLDIMGKGTKPAVVVLNGPTMWALEQAHDGRTSGPLILSGVGRRVTRESAGRTTRRLTKAAGIKGKNITPHSFRHSAITALHDDGVDPRAVQEFARHTKYETTLRYDHKRVTLDEHGAYRMAGYIASRSF
jgi:integrase/recombinase XerD